MQTSRKTTPVRPFQMAAGNIAAAPARKPHRVNLGQDFVLDIAFSANGNCLSVFSLADNRAETPCPHVLCAWLGKDISENRYYVGRDFDLRGAITRMRAMTGFTKNAGGQRSIVINMPRAAQVA